MIKKLIIKNINNTNITPPCLPESNGDLGQNKIMSFKNSARGSILIKMFAIGVLAMLLLIPTGMIKSLIN